MGTSECREEGKVTQVLKEVLPPPGSLSRFLRDKSVILPLQACCKQYSLSQTTQDQPATQGALPAQHKAAPHPPPCAHTQLPTCVSPESDLALALWTNNRFGFSRLDLGFLCVFFHVSASVFLSEQPGPYFLPLMSPQPMSPELSDGQWDSMPGHPPPRPPHSSSGNRPSPPQLHLQAHSLL